MNMGSVTWYLVSWLTRIIQVQAQSHAPWSYDHMLQGYVIACSVDIWAFVRCQPLHCWLIVWSCGDGLWSVEEMLCSYPTAHMLHSHVTTCCDGIFVLQPCSCLHMRQCHFNTHYGRGPVLHCRHAHCCVVLSILDLVKCSLCCVMHVGGAAYPHFDLVLASHDHGVHLHTTDAELALLAFNG
jgi:hypothetical protein